jgi:hypothetical protein
VLPETLQVDEVVDAKVTGRPDDAVALIVTGGVPIDWLDSVPNVIVWESCVTLRLWETVAAGT